MTLNGSGARGLVIGQLSGRQLAYLNQSEHWLLTVRSVWTICLSVGDPLNQYYLPCWSMISESVQRHGDLGSVCFPSRFDGLRTGTTQAYVNHEVDQNATPVMVQVTRNARIDISYRGSELLGSSS